MISKYWRRAFSFASVHNIYKSHKYNKTEKWTHINQAEFYEILMYLKLTANEVSGGEQCNRSQTIVRKFDMIEEISL